MRNAELSKRRHTAVPHGVASATQLFVEKALNAELWDVEGRRFLDFAQGIAVCNTGHCHPKVMAAAKAQCARYNFLRLGKEGYRKIHTACYETAQYLATEIEKLGPFEVMYGGAMDGGIPALCWKVKQGAKLDYSLYDLADRLRGRGWQVPAYSLPANCKKVVVQRILVRHGVSRDLASLLLDDMKQAIGHFDKHPVQTSMTPAEASGFHH